MLVKPNRDSIMECEAAFKASSEANVTQKVHLDSRIKAPDDLQDTNSSVLLLSQI